IGGPTTEDGIERGLDTAGQSRGSPTPGDRTGRGLAGISQRERPAADAGGRAEGDGLDGGRKDGPDRADEGGGGHDTTGQLAVGGGGAGNRRGRDGGVRQGKAERR